MSELERVRRLPVFIDEGQWSRAFEAAKHQVDNLYEQGLIDVPSGHTVNGTLHRAAVQIATAALRAAAQDDEGDIADVPGVRVAQVPNHTTNVYPSTTTTTTTARGPQPPQRVNPSTDDGCIL